MCVDLHDVGGREGGKEGGRGGGREGRRREGEGGRREGGLRGISDTQTLPNSLQTRKTLREGTFSVFLRGEVMIWY